jgi:hypothetical protein
VLESDFYKLLDTLPSFPERIIYFVECTIGYVYYNEIKKDFFHLQDLGGYRKYSLCGTTDLTTSQKFELMLDIKDNTFILSQYDKFSRKRTIIYNGFTEKGTIKNVEMENTRTQGTTISKGV